MTKTISKIYIAADHRGVGVKLYLIEMLAAAGYTVVNLGTDDPNTPVDFPDIAKTLADKMESDEKSRGILANCRKQISPPARITVRSPRPGAR